MLGYISSTRKKSCRQCVKSKRRCDLGFPCCKRCFTKGLDCAYPNASVREAEVVIRQATPEFAPLVGSEVTLGPAEPPSRDVDLALLQSEGSSSPESEPGPLRLSHRTCREPRICKELMTHLWCPCYLTEAQVMFLCGRMCAMVPTLAYSGHTPFIHEALYRNSQPTAYQDSCSLSALYLAKTERNRSILTTSIDDKIAALVASSHGWSLTDHLAAVQALIIYQIIRLFDPDLGAQAQADRQNRLLEVWTAHLWKRSFNEPASFKTCYDAWVFYESIRRTVLMSVFLRGGWSCVNQGGLCDQVPVLARLPLTKDGSLWECDSAAWEQRGPCDKGVDCLIAYGDLSLGWKPGTDPEQLTGFQRMLLAACRGRDDPSLFY
ncbi:hypothetical protein BU26DRAFT_559551 [Trematosphaeria pertusa]|uniref:Zn(2)-C6 fungal-type domain-containing protein n=1 Tax=Trematosphaeria pertusa TaxID=390896 RepID=A0A6A6J0H5_9PLEO|nr:uncharacterized protein BU26DRAFT_559551 [Trematosphaeria pertusa]KAF2254903.1 hypothetical protein BU26DRAFT_559551 [Trematosphaeria pertusa]